MRRGFQRWLLMFVSGSVRLLKIAVELLSFAAISLIQIPLFALQRLTVLLSDVLAWTHRRPVTLADSLQSQQSEPFHKWAVLHETHDDGMVGNEYLAAEELVRNALYGKSTNSTLSLVGILKSQGFDSDETEEMLNACRAGDRWAMRRTIDWVADFIEEEIENEES